MAACWFFPTNDHRRRKPMTGQPTIRTATALMSRCSAKLGLVVGALLAMLVEGKAMAETLNFDDTRAGAPPEGWTLTMTGKGQPKWTVEAEPTAPSKPNVLKQSGQATYPVAIKTGASIRDGFVEVKFKA